MEWVVNKICKRKTRGEKTYREMIKVQREGLREGDFSSKAWD